MNKKENTDDGKFSGFVADGRILSCAVQISNSVTAELPAAMPPGP